jgi:hypothetical protein
MARTAARSNPQMVLNRLHLPYRLVEMIQSDTLVAEVEAARAHVRKLNEQLDAWEAANPHAVHLLPWFEARQAWKDAGRPSPDWWEMLWILGKPEVPLRKKDIDQHLLHPGAKVKVANVRRKAQRMCID